LPPPFKKIRFVDLPRPLWEHIPERVAVRAIVDGDWA
jgi:hypothetical protein